jgi:hypothetical protein
MKRLSARGVHAEVAAKAKGECWYQRPTPQQLRTGYGCRAPSPGAGDKALDQP